MRTLPLNSIRRFVNNRRILRIAGTLLVALIICSCEEYPEPYGAGAGFYPRAAPAGCWHDEGASGKPKIVVRIGEQKAYFYKGKTLVGWTTVSTGKPGFGTPPGHYTVVSKDVDHVSTAFGDYVDGSGNVIRSISTHVRTTSRKEPISMARGCRTRCSSERLRDAPGICSTVCCIARLHSHSKGNGKSVFRTRTRRNAGHSNRVV